MLTFKKKRCNVCGEWVDMRDENVDPGCDELYDGSDPGHYAVTHSGCLLDEDDEEYGVDKRAWLSHKYDIYGSHYVVQ